MDSKGERAKRRKNCGENEQEESRSSPEKKYRPGLPVLPELSCVQMDR